VTTMSSRWIRFPRSSIPRPFLVDDDGAGAGVANSFPSRPKSSSLTMVWMRARGSARCPDIVGAISSGELVEFGLGSRLAARRRGEPLARRRSRIAFGACSAEKPIGAGFGYLVGAGSSIRA